MRSQLIASIAVAVAIVCGPAQANDKVAECKAFFAKFQQCADGLQGEQRDEARIFVRTLKATLGMSDDLNQGDPMYLSIMCGVMIEETKKDSSVKKYNCAW